MTVGRLYCRPMPGDEVDKATGITVGEEYQTSEAGVSYRVLQVSEADEQNLIAASLPPGTQVAQVIHRSQIDKFLNMIPAGESYDTGGDVIITSLQYYAKVAHNTNPNTIYD